MKVKEDSEYVNFAEFVKSKVYPSFKHKREENEKRFLTITIPYLWTGNKEELKKRIHKKVDELFDEDNKEKVQVTLSYSEE